MSTSDEGPGSSGLPRPPQSVGGADRANDAEDGGGTDDAGSAQAGSTGPEGERRRRRRRRRRPGGGAAAADAPAGAEPGSDAVGASRDDAPREAADQRDRRGPGQRGGEQRARGADQRGNAQRSGEQRTRGGEQRTRGGEQHGRGPRAAEQRSRGGEQRSGEQRGRERRRERRGRDDGRDREPRQNAAHAADLDDDILHGDPYRSDPHGASDIAAEPSRPSDRLPPRHDDDDDTAAPAIAWGKDDDSPAPAVALAPDLPVDAPADDPDPLTYPLVDGPSAQLGDDVASVVSVRFVPAGRIQWCNAGETEYAPGERVIVDSDRGQRLAWIATPPSRRATRDRGLRRVIRRANEHDLRGERDGDADRQHLLRLAKDKAAALRLPLKVFRVEKTGGKLNVYYTSDERLDLRDFVRDIGQASGLRIELRQLGVRDEAKAVGGIGSCGLTLCCTTWLPDFVPVSIKMAKDQGLVLSPTKVSGQCGRLKCCLVYEQAGYAELRKGLPKLGKRVISPRGEGRVVEVDVLRQRVRVSYGAGDTEVLPATEVKPMFPSGNQPREPEHEHDPDPDLPTS